MSLWWIASVCPSISSLHSTSFFSHLFSLINEDHIDKTSMLPGFPLGLANKSLSKRSEGRRRVRLGCVFPWLLPQEAALDWHVLPSRISGPFQATFTIQPFFSGSATAPSPHPSRSRCSNTSSTAPSLRLLHYVLWLSYSTFPSNIHLYKQSLCK